MKYLTYLANPYSLVPTPEWGAWNEMEIKQKRFEMAAKVTAYLMDEYGWNVFSPIVHSHPLHTVAGMRGDWKFWQRVDTQYIKLSARVVVLCLGGWRDSVGVGAEIEIAQRLKIPILYMHPVTLKLSKTPHE